MPNAIGPTGQSAWPFELLAEPPPEARGARQLRPSEHQEQPAIRDQEQRGFGSAALSCAARDRFLGWSRETQYARLRHVVNNQRFCVLPAGGRPNLASAVLSRVLRRLAGDYLAVYGHRVLAVETFTDPARHTGACYAAANFVLLGETLGYARSAGR